MLKCMIQNCHTMFTIHTVCFRCVEFSLLYPRSTKGEVGILISGHKLHIGASYRGKRFWTRQIPTSSLPTLLIFIHIEHICSFFVAYFSGTIDGRNLIFGHKLHIGTPYRGKHCWIHQIPTSCLPKSGGIISEH